MMQSYEEFLFFCTLTVYLLVEQPQTINNIMRKAILLLGAALAMLLASQITVQAQDAFSPGEMLIMSQTDFDATSNLFIDNAANLRAGLKYKNLKRHYDRSDYRKLDDPAYGTGRAWLNLILPGLAQFTMGEPGLGVKYILTTVVVPSAVMGAGYGLALAGALAEQETPGSGEAPVIVGGGLLTVGSIICLLSEIASISNAFKVAKVKSLYEDDLAKAGLAYQFEWSPMVLPVHTPNGYAMAPGVGLRLSF